MPDDTNDPPGPVVDFALLEAVLVVKGEYAKGGCCMAEAPPSVRPPNLTNAVSSLPCTRSAGHPGEHVAAHVDGYALARWTSPDVTVERLGTVVLLSPLTVEARTWLEQHTDAPAWAWQSGGLAVEPRMVDAVIGGLTAAGFTVEGPEAVP